MIDYTLVLGNRNYSSWSMRAWLLMRLAEVPFDVTMVPLYEAGSKAAVQKLGGETGLVPVLVADGQPIWDTLAITETLHEASPLIWPSDPVRRARARSYAGEVHSSLNALRSAMPVNTRARTRQPVIDDDVRADISRVCTIWARAGRHPEGPWLFGTFCAVDIMFAPVAARFQTYAIEPTAEASAYYNLLLNHPWVAEWFALGAAEVGMIPMFELPNRQ
ncbi:MAG: glutathione S-transferase [Janthinobacterium lividum]